MVERNRDRAVFGVVVYFHKPRHQRQRRRVVYKRVDFETGGKPGEQAEEAVLDPAMVQNLLIPRAVCELRRSVLIEQLAHNYCHCLQERDALIAQAKQRGLRKQPSLLAIQVKRPAPPFAGRARGPHSPPGHSFINGAGRGRPLTRDRPPATRPRRPQLVAARPSCWPRPSRPLRHTHPPQRPARPRPPASAWRRSMFRPASSFRWSRRLCSAACTRASTDPRATESWAPWRARCFSSQTTVTRASSACWPASAARSNTPLSAGRTCCLRER